MESLIMEEEIDGNFEPSHEEILEYAKWLGMDLPREQELLWVAREGLKAPLPEHWKPCKSPDGDIYYFNFSNGDSVWEHPCDEFYRNLFAEERKKFERRKAQEKQQAEQQKLPKPVGGGGGGHRGGAGGLGAVGKLEDGRRGALLKPPKKSPLGQQPPLRNPAIQVRKEPTEEVDSDSEVDDDDGEDGASIAVGAMEPSPGGKMVGGMRGLLRRGGGSGKDDSSGTLKGLPSMVAALGDSSDSLGESLDSVRDSMDSVKNLATLSMEDEPRTEIMDKLESEREKWEEGLRANLAEQKNKMEAELREKMERELKEIEEDMEAMRDRRMLELQEANEMALENLKASHQVELEDMMEEHENEIQRLQSRHTEEMERLGAEHREAMEQRRMEMAQLQAEHHEAVQSMKDQISASTLGVEEEAEEEAQERLEVLRAERFRALQEELEEEREKLKREELTKIKAQAAVDAASVRGSETAAAMERMRSAVETEVKAYRAQLEEELRAEAEDELRQRIRAEVEAKRHSPSSRADENRFQEDEALRALSNGRAAMLEETSKKIAEEERQLLEIQRRDMKARVDRLIEEEEAELRRSRRKDIDGRVTMQLYEQEAAMLKERRHEVVDKVVKEMSEFEEALARRLREEARQRAVAEAGRARFANLEEEVEAEVSKEKERLMREAMRKVRAEVEAEAEHLHIRMRVEGGAPEAKVSLQADDHSSSADDGGSGRARGGLATPRAEVKAKPKRRTADRRAKARQRQRSRADQSGSTISDNQSSLLAMARSFLQQQKRYLQERSDLLQHARAQWQANCRSGNDRASAGDSQLMGFVKATLEEQTRRLNSEVKQFKRLKDQVRAMESGRAEVRDITEDIMDMRARAAATAGTPMNPFAGLAMPSPAASTPIAVGPLGPENPGGSMYSTPAGMGSFGVGRGGRWRDAGSDGILSKMYGERQAMSSLMSNYSSWLKGMKEAIPSGYFANPVMPSSPPRQTDRFAIPPGGAYHADAGSIMQVQGGLTPAPHPLHQEAGNDGTYRLDLDCDRELVIALRAR